DGRVWCVCGLCGRGPPSRSGPAVAAPGGKYLQQLWDTVVLAALILSTGVIVQARWQYQDNQFNDELEVNDHLLTALTLRVSVQYRDQPVEGNSCAVCLEQYSNNQCLRVLPCLHEFHRDCVDPWLLLQQTCPLCKRSVLDLKSFPHPKT
uniref:RING-type domain-containing protein n=1 Tax=Electrophorus electricus TaxID=8005 RepID=A0A4W4F4I7_ELEEL